MRAQGRDPYVSGSGPLIQKPHETQKSAQRRNVSGRFVNSVHCDWPKPNDDTVQLDYTVLCRKLQPYSHFQYFLGVELSAGMVYNSIIKFRWLASTIQSYPSIQSVQGHYAFGRFFAFQEYFGLYPKYEK
jgi:hypothetical protein